ncbi:MAG: uracil-DNA glycosylase [Chloroflexota bacterium]
MSSTLESLNREVEDCRDCGLAQQRTRVVPGEGPENAAILFIGEAPGFHEDQQGRPFVGAAGQFLEELLALIGYRRDQVFIANVVKCRPPDNRDPLPVEIQACRKWLDRQVELIRPKVIVTLGRYSMVRFFPGESISKIHGKPKRRDGIIYYPMYHPAAALHQGGLRETIKADMLRIPELLLQASRQRENGPQQARQLGMF